MRSGCPALAGQLEEILARHNLAAEVATVPANLEEAFVSIVTGGTYR